MGAPRSTKAHRLQMANQSLDLQTQFCFAAFVCSHYHPFIWFCQKIWYTKIQWLTVIILIIFRHTHIHPFLWSINLHISPFGYSQEERARLKSFGRAVGTPWFNLGGIQRLLLGRHQNPMDSHDVPLFYSRHLGGIPYLQTNPHGPYGNINRFNPYKYFVYPPKVKTSSKHKSNSFVGLQLQWLLDLFCRKDCCGRPNLTLKVPCMYKE